MDFKNIKFNYSKDVNNNKKLEKSKKVKYFDNSTRDSKCMPDNKYKSRVEDESFLLLPRMNSKQKTKMELKNEMHPNNYDVDWNSKNIIKTKQHNSYYGNHYGPGKGFGNAKVSNDIRNGKSTRLSNSKFQEIQESTINNRTDIIFKNYQDPKHLILPFPRGGEITRKSLQSNNMSKEISDYHSEFKFKY